MDAAAAEFPADASCGVLGAVRRLGLATRGNTRLDAEDVLEAVRRGVTYLNWCGYRDGMSDAISQLGAARRGVQVAIQLQAHDAAAARRELDEAFAALGTDYVDVVTHYYLESPGEWERIQAPGGAGEALREYRAAGKVRMVGVTSHQRPLAAELTAAGDTELLMIRYNAAHRGAEAEVFPVAREHGVPIVAYTALRWGALLKPTVADPEGVRPPDALECYRFSLMRPEVTVCLAAPNGRAELEEDLRLLEDRSGLDPQRYREIVEHGDRVRRHGGGFP